MSNLSTIPVKAADLIRERGWTQNSFETRDGALCLHGAILACTPHKGDAEIVRDLARRQGFTENWNDTDDRTESEVLNALAHIDTSDAAIEEIFGPQWEHVVALVRRAATLTEDEEDRLRVAWMTARITAGSVARTTAGSVAWTPAWEVAWTVAWEVARTNARTTAWTVARTEAAQEAAQALVVRDLIGTGGFTQEHYDTLSAPWVSVIGPAHPDD